MSRTVNPDAYGTARAKVEPDDLEADVAVLTIVEFEEVEVDDPDQQRQIEERGVAITFASKTGFGILASHLLLHLDQRTLALEPAGTIRRSVRTYLPLLEYINDCIRDRMFSMTLWHERKASVISSNAPPSGVRQNDPGA